MAAPTTAARMKKALANPEPSTHGPTLPTWALQQVGSYPGYTGRDANVVAKAGVWPDPEAPTAGLARMNQVRGSGDKQLGERISDSTRSQQAQSRKSCRNKLMGISYASSCGGDDHRGIPRRQPLIDCGRGPLGRGGPHSLARPWNMAFAASQAALRAWHAQASVGHNMP